MNFLNHFKNRYPFLEERDFEAFYTIAARNHYKKGEKIIDFGEKKKKVAVITKGIVRGFLINSQGKEITTFIFSEYSAFSAYEPLVLNQPTKQIFECLENTEAYVFDFNDLTQITKQHPNIKKIKDAIIMAGMARSFQRNESFIMESPEKRYLSFIKNHSDLMQRVSQKHIASYLGITAVSFSRLKKRIYMQQE